MDDHRVTEVDVATLWTAIVTLPLMAVVQFICAKIGMVSGRGLAGVLRQYYPRTVLYPAVLGLVIANTINVGTDIAAIAAAINMFLPIPITALVVPIAVIIVVLQIWGSYRLMARIFKWLTVTLFARPFFHDCVLTISISPRSLRFWGRPSPRICSSGKLAKRSRRKSAWAAPAYLSGRAPPTPN